MPDESDVPGIIWDTTDLGGTYRPNEPPISTRGTEFNPLYIQKRVPVV